ncbi:unnamed protein product [Amoebophrya sp. A25]|nr:unnamed protein product [Amoebophrya sp. A25]|eukprot:GSA25T00015016001.1
MWRLSAQRGLRVCTGQLLQASRPSLFLQKSAPHFALLKPSAPKRLISLVPKTVQDYFGYFNRYIGPRGWVGLYPLGFVIALMTSGHYFVVIRERDRQFMGTNMVNVWADSDNTGLEWRHPYVRGSCYETMPQWKGKDRWRGSQQVEGHHDHDEHHH